MKTFNAYAQYYDLLYKDKDYLAEANYVDKLIKTENKEANNILNLGCGTGKHDFHFINKGYEVTGIDISEEMIKEANTALSKHPASDKASFAVADIRSYRTNKKFDVIVSLFHVLSYQTSNNDVIGLLATAKRHMKEDAVLILDCWYGPAVLTDRPAERIKNLENEHINVIRTARPVIYANTNLVDVNYEVTITHKSDPHSIQRIEETHTMRYFFMPEIELFLQQAGLKLERAEEWMTGNEPGFNSWNTVFICKKS